VSQKEARYYIYNNIIIIIIIVIVIIIIIIIIIIFIIIIIIIIKIESAWRWNRTEKSLSRKNSSQRGEPEGS